MTRWMATFAAAVFVELAVQLGVRFRVVFVAIVFRFAAGLITAFFRATARAQRHIFGVRIVFVVWRAMRYYGR